MCQCFVVPAPAPFLPRLLLEPFSLLLQLRWKDPSQGHPCATCRRGWRANSWGSHHEQTCYSTMVSRIGDGLGRAWNGLARCTPRWLLFLKYAGTCWYGRGEQHAWGWQSGARRRRDDRWRYRQRRGGDCEWGLEQSRRSGRRRRHCRRRGRWWRHDGQQWRRHC